VAWKSGKGKKLSTATRKKISASLKGKKRKSHKISAKADAARRGKKHPHKGSHAKRHSTKTRAARHVAKKAAVKHVTATHAKRATTVKRKTAATKRPATTRRLASATHRARNSGSRHGHSKRFRTHFGLQHHRVRPTIRHRTQRNRSAIRTRKR
jgi:hypothetical protein